MLSKKTKACHQETLGALLRHDEFLFIGFFLSCSVSRKNLGDWVLWTLVIQEQTPVKSHVLKISEDAKRLAKKLLQEADFSRLLPEDFPEIR